MVAAVALGWWALSRQPEAAPPPLSFEAPPAASGGSPGDCYFNWATQPLDDLSTHVQAAMQEVQPGAEARAEAYGEDCIYADGHADFHAMETDFHVALKVADANDPAELGGLIRRSMDLLASRFPTGQTPGPQPGRVNFRFLSPSAEKNLPVQVADYQNLPSGLTDAEIYQTLFPNP